MRDMVIDSIRVSLLNYQRVVILKEKDSDRYLPIWIGPSEADAIAVKLQNVDVPRPLTHDLLGQVISDLGATVDHILISGLDHDTYFAKIMLKVGDQSISIDSRPSDALALAVRVEVPIFAEDEVMEKAGVHLDKETGKAIVGDALQEASERSGSPVGEGEIKSMSAFTDFIDSLDLSDFEEGDDGKPRRSPN